MTATQRRIKRQERADNLRALNLGLKSGKVVMLYRKCELTGIHYRPDE